MMPITPVVKQLLIINILFFVGSQLVPQAYDYLSLYYFDNDQFHFWQLLTHMFMHAPISNIGHIMFNMFALYMFGSSLEHFWGGKRFIFFYISCGLGAAALQLLINYISIQQTLEPAAYLNLSHRELYEIFNTDFRQGTSYTSELLLPKIEEILRTSHPGVSLTQESLSAIFNAAIESKGVMVGASGAIYGLLVAFAFMFPNAEMFIIFLPIPVKAKYFVPVLIGFDLVSGISSTWFGTGSNIAHFAHVGGALFGFIMMWYWKKNRFNHNRWN